MSFRIWQTVPCSTIIQLEMPESLLRVTKMKVESGWSNRSAIVGRLHLLVSRARMDESVMEAEAPVICVH